MSVDVAIVGLGYVGLPLAQEGVTSRPRVLGYDIGQRVVEGLNAGESVDDLSDADIAEMRAAGFEATTDASRLREAKTIVICVPTPLSDDGGPDLGPVVSAVTTIRGNLQKGMLVILESTTYPGTTDEVVRPIRRDRPRRRAGLPPRLLARADRPGQREVRRQETPQGRRRTDPGVWRCGGGLLWPVRGHRRARQGHARGRDGEAPREHLPAYQHRPGQRDGAVLSRPRHRPVGRHRRGQRPKPFGFQAFYPGPGVGGHCIPIDPNYLSHNVRARLGYPFRFVRLAQEINATMPAYVVQRAQNLLKDAKPLRGSTVLLLGVTLGPISPTSASPLPSRSPKQLADKGAVVQYHDPHVPRVARPR